ncbi:MAG: hypothetical protein AB1728_13155 [Bacteroidota bacterium]
MLITRTSDDQIIIKVSPDVDRFGLQRALDYLKFLETTAGGKATQAEADAIAEKVNSSWWKKNKKRFVK